MNYNTDLGFGISTGWEHRNFLSHGEKFSTTLSAATFAQQLNTTLEKPYFLREDQRLKLANTIRQENTKAFRVRGANISAGVERDLKNKWVAGISTIYGFEQIKNQNNKENVALLSLPIFVSQDKRDDQFNPTEGWRLECRSSPALDTMNTKITFLKNTTSGSYYRSFDMAGQPVIAARVATGAILGLSRDNIPAPERFYAGGGGSVRGYGYQLVGPLNAQNNPLGGKSFVELSTELRLRVTQDYGLVAFVDGGNVSNKTYSHFSSSLLWGAGIGFRYYTGLGPIRIDIAMPLNKRRGVDSALQFYFSIGQAF